MNISEIIIGLMTFTIILTSTLFFSGAIFGEYNSGIKNQKQFQELDQLAESVQKNTTEKYGQSGTAKNETFGIGSSIGSGVFLLQGVWNVISTTLKSFALIPAIAGTFFGSLPLPNYAESLFIGLLSSMFIIAAIKAYRQGI